MASQYFAILTDYGITAFANALSSKQPLQLTTFAVGDGNGQAVTPTANRTALAREKHRAPVSAVSLDPRNKKQVIVELTIPENVGGFYIREMGVFDNQNKLVAYANCPESFKPLESSGSGKVQVLRMILKVSSSSAVTLSIDHSVIFVTRQQLNPKTLTAETQNGFDETGHTHEIDRATTAKAGIVQLSNDDNSDDETKAPTLKAIKKLKGLYDGLRRLLDSYIPNSKKSNAVNSPSSETIATSAAAKTAYDKGVEAKNAADNAQRTADEAVRFNRNYFSGDLNSLNDKHEICYLEQAQTKNRNFPSNAYQWGILHVYSNGTLGSQVYYADNGELWARTRWHSHDWNEWKRLDGLNIPALLNAEIVKVKSIADSNTRNFANYIPNSKKSNAVDSTSTDTIASSRAVKLAYDRGTTALNTANSANTNATNANNNANSRVSKSGDTITGNLHIKSGDYSSVRTYNTNNEHVRWESMPASDSNSFAKITRVDSKDNVLGAIYMPKKNGTAALLEDFTNPEFTLTNNANNNASLNNITGTRFLSFGDGALNGLGLPGGSDWVGIQIADQTGQKTQIISGGYDNHYIRTNDDLSKNVWHSERLLTDVTLQRLVNRRDYNRTIKGTNDWDNGKQKDIAISGQVITYPDGRIQQIFHLKHFRMTWFAWEDHNIGYTQGSRGVEIFLQLWSAMPNKIINIQAIGSRSTNANTSASFCNEAGEFTIGWNLRKQGNNKDRIWINTARLSGGQDEFMDLYVVVEGY